MTDEFGMFSKIGKSMADTFDILYKKDSILQQQEKRIYIPKINIQIYMKNENKNFDIFSNNFYQPKPGKRELNLNKKKLTRFYNLFGENFNFKNFKPKIVNIIINYI